ncbi:hypothetical protein M3Y99_00800700 [Aphelenchoides fujianensis]|nr:hypothetical protein M3Y99_00800700 [Aphelenchoides fujianensis]
MSSGRVAQLPKFAVVDVMIALNGRECLASDRYDVKDAFWKAVLNRLNELYPENVSDVRTVNHVKRTWSALRQRVLQRSHNPEDVPAASSDRRVLYLLKLVDTYDDGGGGVAPSPLGSSIGASSPAGSRFGASADHSFFGRAWHNARSMCMKRVQDGTRDFSFLERKVLYLLRVLNAQTAGIEITNGVVYDVLGDNDDADLENMNDNAKVCTVLKTEPLSLEWLNNLTRGVVDGQQENEPFGEAASTASPPPPLRPKRVDPELEHRLILCKIEREKAQTELLKAQHRLVIAQLRNLDKTGLDSNFNFLDFESL